MNCRKRSPEDSRRYKVNIPGDDVLVLPAELVTESADGAVLAARLETEDTESLRDDHALLVVVWGWDTLEGLKTLHGGGAAGGLVRNHATDSAPEHLGWRTVMPWTTTGGVETGLLAEEGLVLDCMIISVSFDAHSHYHAPSLILIDLPIWALLRRHGRLCGICGKRTLGAEELSRDVEGLAADDNNLLAFKKLLGDSAGQTTEQVSLAVNDDLYPRCQPFDPDCHRSISRIFCLLLSHSLHPSLRLRGGFHIRLAEIPTSCWSLGVL